MVSPKHWTNLSSNMEIKHEIVQPTPRLPFKYYFHDKNSSKTVAPHWHQSLELGFLVSDNDLKFKDNGDTFNYHKGDIWIVNSRNVHGSTINTTKSLFEFCLIIDYDFLKQIYPNIDQIHFSLHGRPHSIKKIMSYQELEKQLRIIIQLLQEPRDSNSTLALTGRVYLLLSILLDNFSSKVNAITAVNDSLVDRALGTINQDYHDNLNGTLLANKLNTSVTTLNQQFHQTVQMPINKYITVVRLLNAQKKLLNTTNNIDFIATECGFSSTKSFVRNFKKWKGVTPFRYRKTFN